MPKVLIVDDDMDWVKVLAMRLRQGGFEVVAATDAYQGVALAHKESPDCIILDISMPAGGGMTALRNVRMTLPGQMTPVIVVSGVGEPETRRALQEAGVKTFLSKPCKAEDVVEAIRKALEGADTA